MWADRRNTKNLNIEENNVNTIKHAKSVNNTWVLLKCKKNGTWLIKPNSSEFRKSIRRLRNGITVVNETSSAKDESISNNNKMNSWNRRLLEKWGHSLLILRRELEEYILNGKKNLRYNPNRLRSGENFRDYKYDN